MAPGQCVHATHLPCAQSMSFEATGVVVDLNFKGICKFVLSKEAIIFLFLTCHFNYDDVGLYIYFLFITTNVFEGM